MAIWGVAEAKAKFSELVEDARAKGPQQITRNGKPVAVVVSAEEWRHRGSGSVPLSHAPIPSGKRLWEALRAAPRAGEDDAELPRIPWQEPRKVEF